MQPSMQLCSWILDSAETVTEHYNIYVNFVGNEENINVFCGALSGNIV
jgi:hypothetical protein